MGDCSPDFFFCQGQLHTPTWLIQQKRKKLIRCIPLTSDIDIPKQSICLKGDTLLHPIISGNWVSIFNFRSTSCWLFWDMAHEMGIPFSPASHGNPRFYENHGCAWAVGKIWRWSWSFQLSNLELPKSNGLHLKHWPWKMSFFFWKGLLPGAMLVLGSVLIYIYDVYHSYIIATFNPGIHTTTSLTPRGVA